MTDDEEGGRDIPPYKPAETVSAPPRRPIFAEGSVLGPGDTFVQLRRGAAGLRAAPDPECDWPNVVAAPANVEDARVARALRESGLDGSRWVSETSDWPVQVVPREDVYDALNSERAYQDAKFPGEAPSVAEAITLVDVYLARAKQAWAGSLDTTPALAELRKVAALVVRAMESHGAPAADRTPSEASGRRRAKGARSLRRRRADG